MRRRLFHLPSICHNSALLERLTRGQDRAVVGLLRAVDQDPACEAISCELLLLEVVFTGDVGRDFEGPFPDCAVELEDCDAFGGGCGD